MDQDSDYEDDDDDDDNMDRAMRLSLLSAASGYSVEERVAKNSIATGFVCHRSGVTHDDSGSGAAL